MGRQSAVTAPELFEYLCQSKNGVSWVQAPAGHDLLVFLCERFGIKTKTTIDKVLDELVLYKLILKEYYKNKLFRIKLLHSDWNEVEIPLELQKVKPGSDAETRVKRRLLQENHPEKIRKFSIFIDYKNISDGMEKEGRRLKDFYPLLQHILEKGQIIFKFVFVPKHFMNRIPVMELSYKYNAHVVVCPLQIEGAITKDQDSVDAHIISLARELIEHSPGITDFAIFSGDGDFHRLVDFAFCHQKRVTVIATRDSISGRFLEMAEEKVVEVVLV